MSDRRIVVLRDAQVYPILMEVGAINKPPFVWTPLAMESTYVGIGPMAESPPERVEYR